MYAIGNLVEEAFSDEWVVTKGTGLSIYTESTPSIKSFLKSIKITDNIKFRQWLISDDLKKNVMNGWYSSDNPLYAETYPEKVIILEMQGIINDKPGFEQIVSNLILSSDYIPYICTPRTVGIYKTKHFDVYHQVLTRVHPSFTPKDSACYNVPKEEEYNWDFVDAREYTTEKDCIEKVAIEDEFSVVVRILSGDIQTNIQSLKKIVRYLN